MGGREAELQGDIPEISSGCFRVYFILFHMCLYVTKVHLPLVRAVSWVPDPELQNDPLRLRQGKEEP